MDKEDNSIVDAALRETEEELGINKTAVEVWVEAFPIPDRVNIFVDECRIICILCIISLTTQSFLLPVCLVASWQLFCVPSGI